MGSVMEQGSVKQLTKFYPLVVEGLSMILKHRGADILFMLGNFNINRPLENFIVTKVVHESYRLR